MANFATYHDRLHRGFTLIEVLISVAVLSILVAVTIPLFTKDDRQRLNAAAMILASDIELAQVMSISNPSKPVVVRFDNIEPRYWLAYADDPNTPLTRPDLSEQYDVTMGAGRAATAMNVNITLIDLPSRTLEFTAHGGLADFSMTPSVLLMIGADAFPRVRLTISPTTGTVTLVYERGS